MSRFEGPQGIVTNGLVLNLDASDPDSYTRSQPPYVEVLVVAGGGGGSGNFYDDGAGGGAGGLIYNSAYQLTNAAAITVTVGSGGAGSQDTGTNGSNSVFGSLTAIGGGRGGSTTHGTTVNGADGGSGGGGGDYNGDGGNGTIGQGFRGGNSRQAAGIGAGASGGGGGGAGGPGEDCINSYSQISGGPSITYSISGTSTAYAAGGASLSAADTANPAGASGGANTGTGGQGARFNVGGNGGSGIVIIRYPGLPAATGGTITYLNGYTIHTFTSSGTFTPYTWNDVSGNGYNGTLVNGVTFNSYQNGGGLIFDGTDDYVDLQYAIIGGTGDFTVNQWIQADASETGGTTFGNYPAGTLQIFYGTTFMGMWLNNNTTYVGTPVPFSSNPVMITAIRSGTTTYFYQNGVLLKTGSSSANIGAANFRIGTNTTTIEQFTGKVFVTQTYNRALSSTEVTQNFNAQRNRFGV